MPEVTLDDRGRLTLPKEFRERYGEHYHVVGRQNGIKLVPIDDDPLAALREEFEGVEKSADELRVQVRESATDE
ncbi:MAG: AbrB/MazE/SpoVT family DNA-binding domain-containing protein [Halorientalis sp.]